MSEVFRVHPQTTRPTTATTAIKSPCATHHNFDHDILNGYEWNISRDGPSDRLHYKMRDFRELFDHGSDEYRPVYRRDNKNFMHRCSDGARTEIADSRMSRKDLPSAGQIIWDDIGEGVMVESLSWSQSDVEREIESWDQKLNETNIKCQKSVAWDDGDMIRFDDSRDVYLPSRSGSIGYHDDRWKNPRKLKDVRSSSSLQSYDKQIFGESQKDLIKTCKKFKCDDNVGKNVSLVDSSDIVTGGPLKDNKKFHLNS
ncbi:hypothetical protein Phum_PHUM411090 [Pediculus humanus corporis]|uniref:Uncharacterized protein n=1 Tax=Pediculus humanus subsp. corporis TaxID=121224 RepID=E0VS37_PEDHC|nr:uncharacterized protein Phum_PHUM411090 [Pediculus humanus corporis]EEB16193.1 hypothetical protein Phum_PHUM411090 [Pediculus humanus corporis]